MGEKIIARLSLTKSFIWTELKWLLGKLFIRASRTTLLFIKTLIYLKCWWSSFIKLSSHSSSSWCPMKNIFLGPVSFTCGVPHSLSSSFRMLIRSSESECRWGRWCKWCKFVCEMTSFILFSTFNVDWETSCATLLINVDSLRPVASVKEATEKCRCECGNVW